MIIIISSSIFHWIGRFRILEVMCFRDVGRMVNLLFRLVDEREISPVRSPFYYPA